MTGMPEEEAERASRAGVKNKVRKYLAAMLGQEIDVDDSGNPWGRWFRDGYMLRNQAIHEGASVDHDAAERAFLQASAVFDELRERLVAVAPLSELGKMLEIYMRDGESDRGDELLGIRFPWE